ncbi:MAG: hypothetical protein MUW56_06840 [Chryseobacterium sp.]|uniref:hypothetical protein n=1 Tax=Chryseobacterium sp. TaxID=1871047 RepID=UPI0025BF655F|nr:hypothetical protein [Chryseobacterium sp.]MCJ7933349.1 hypothetical protein [Chryseobacterium sp.]
MKLKIVVLIILFSAVKIFATSQVADKIIINTMKYDLINTPLEKYFDEHPEYHPLSGNKLKLFKDQNGESIIPLTSANYRGYVATFKIENNTLSLEDLEVPNPDTVGNTYISVYQKIFGNKKITINYSGILMIPLQVVSSTIQHPSEYRYRLITVRKDHVEKEKELDQNAYKKFKARRFNEYKKTEEYKNNVEKLIKEWNIDSEKEFPFRPTQKNIDRFMRGSTLPDFIIVDY